MNDRAVGTAPPPRVSLCVPTIGRVEFLASTRDSIAAQTYGDYEVLILDNASPSESRPLIDAWAASDPRVRLLRIADRIPMFENFNRGIHAARGEYVTFCHDDDVVAPTFLERHVAFLDAHRTVGFSGSSYEYIDESGNVTELRSAGRRSEVWSGRRYIRTLLGLGRNPLTMQSIFYRRAALGPDGIDVALPIHFGDFVLLMRMAERHDVGVLAEPLVKVRRHRLQASSTVPLRKAFGMRKAVLDAYIDELAARLPDEPLLVRELRLRFALAHRSGLLWSWVCAEDAAEARACASSLGTTPVDVGLGLALRGIDRLAPPTTPRRGALVEAARRLANG